MKGIAASMCISAFLAMTAVAQESESTTITTTTSGGADLIHELWTMQDATILGAGTTDLRLTGRWSTAGFPGNGGDSDDTFVVQPSLYWGTCDNVEAFVTVPFTIGDGGDVGPIEDGNGDATVGFTWRFAEPDGSWPAMALQTSARIPTGNNSSGVDGELRLIMSNEYDSGVRSHVNGWLKSINGDNDEALRDFNWGVVLGLDGPLCDDGAVRWVLDYVVSRGAHESTQISDVVELGWQWELDAASRFGMSFQVGVDHAGDQDNLGATMTYATALTN